MLEERVSVLDHFVQAPIQVVLLRQVKTLSQQIGHRAVLKPLPVQSPLAARVDQTINRQGLQHVTPASPLARVRQTLLPERFQLQLIPQLAPYPAGAPLPGTAQLKLFEPYLHAIDR